MQTYRSVYIVHNVAHAGALVLRQFSILIHVERSAKWFGHTLMCPDDVPQHQHIVRRLALPRVGFGPHARTDATYERFELGGLEWRLADLQLYLLTQRPSRVNSGLIIIYRVRVSTPSTPSTQNPDERARSDRAHATTIHSDRAHATTIQGQLRFDHNLQG